MCLVNSFRTGLRISEKLKIIKIVPWSFKNLRNDYVTTPAKNWSLDHLLQHDCARYCLVSQVPCSVLFKKKKQTLKSYQQFANWFMNYILTCKTNEVLHWTENIKYKTRRREWNCGCNKNNSVESLFNYNIEEKNV